MNEQLDPEVFRRELIQALDNAPEGHLKNASEASRRMVRRRIRENGFGRLILPFKPVTNADLNPLPDTELPVIIEEMEPESLGAKAISFNDTADTAFYRGDKFVVYFCKITTEARTKHLWLSLSIVLTRQKRLPTGLVRSISHSRSYLPHPWKSSSHEAPRISRSLVRVGRAGKYSPASMLCVYRVERPTFSANTSWVSPLPRRRRTTFLPNWVRRGHEGGFREGTAGCSGFHDLRNTRLYIVSQVWIGLAPVSRFPMCSVLSPLCLPCLSSVAVGAGLIPDGAKSPCSAEHSKPRTK